LTWKKIVVLIVFTAGTIVPAFAQDAVELYIQGREAFDSENFSTASALLNQLVRRFPQDSRADDAAYLSAVSQFKLGKFDEARRGMSSLRRLYPESGYMSRVSYYIGAAAMQQKDFETAVREFAKQTEYPEVVNFYHRSYLYQAVSLEKLRRYEEAIKTYQSLLAQSPSQELFSQAHYRIGLLATRENDFPLALGSFTHVLDSGKLEYAREALFQLAEVYFQMGNYSAAKDRFQRFISEYPSNIYTEQALFRLGTLTTREGNWEEGLAYYDLLLSTFPKGEFSGSTLELIGWHYLELGRWEEAVGSFNALLSSNDDPQTRQTAYFNIGTSHYYLKQWQKAENAFLQSREGPSENLRMQSLYFAAKVQTSENNYQDARKNLQALMREAPEHPWALSAAKVSASLAVKLGDSQEILGSLNYLIERYPDNPDLGRWHYQRGQTALESGDYDLALESFQEARRQNPDKTTLGEILYKIGYVYTLRGEHLRAESYYFEVTETVAPGEIYFRSQLARGVSFYNARDWEKSQGVFNRMIREDSQGEWAGLARFYLADVYQRQGKKRLSAQIFAESVTYLDESKALEGAERAGALYLELEEYTQALSTWQSYGRLPGADAALSGLKQSESYQGLGQWQNSLSILPSVGRSNPYAARIGYRRALASYHLGQRGWINTLENIGDQDLAGEALLRIAILEAQKEGGNPQEFLKNILQAYPDSAAAPLASIRLAQIITQDGDETGALGQYLRFFQQFGNTIHGPIGARSLGSNGAAFTDPQGIENFFRQVGTLDLTQETREELDWFYAMRIIDTRPEEGEGLLLRLARQGQKDDLRGRSYLELGEWFLRKEDFSRAESAFSVLAQSPIRAFHGRANLGLGRSQLAQERFREAGDTLLQATVLLSSESPYYPMAVYYAIQAFSTLGDSSQVAELEQILANRSEDYWSVKYSKEKALQNP
jgi:TolA-binding protein